MLAYFWSWGKQLCLANKFGSCAARDAFLGGKWCEHVSRGGGVGKDSGY